MVRLGRWSVSKTDTNKDNAREKPADIGKWSICRGGRYGRYYHIFTYRCVSVCVCVCVLLSTIIIIKIIYKIYIIHYIQTAGGSVAKVVLSTVPVIH